VCVPWQARGVGGMGLCEKAVRVFMLARARAQGDELAAAAAAAQAIMEFFLPLLILHCSTHACMGLRKWTAHTRAAQRGRGRTGRGCASAASTARCVTSVNAMRATSTPASAPWLSSCCTRARW